MNRYAHFVLVLVLTCAIISSESASTETCSLNSVCFALDQSFSITGRGDYPDVKRFAITAAQEINTRTVGTSYSAIGFDGQSRTIQSPTTDIFGDFIPAVNNGVAPGGSTNLLAGLEACFDAVKGQNGNRVIVLVTDGNGGDPSSIKATIETAGVKVVSVGIGQGIDIETLSAIASKPEFFIEVKNTEELAGKAFSIAEKTCEVVDEPEDDCESAYATCEFQFENQNTVPTYEIGKIPDSVFSDRIVSKSAPKIGVLNTNGIVVEFIEKTGVAKEITNYASPRLTPTHFKPISISNSPLSTGIAHQTFTGNQLQKSRDRCVRIFFTQYQTITISPTPRVLDNVNADVSDNKCVVFKTM